MDRATVTGGRRERRIILAALFISLGVALGFALAWVPNVELVTLTIFLGGVFLGAGTGAVVGAATAAFHSLLNPLGPGLPPLLASQIASCALTGAFGGLLAPLAWRGGGRGMLASATAGFALTVVYDVATTLAIGLVTLGRRGFAEGIAGVFFAGALFIVVHVVTNTVVFAAAVVPVTRIVTAWRRGREEGA